jgi:hypothetical protein
LPLLLISLVLVTVRPELDRLAAPHCLARGNDMVSLRNEGCVALFFMEI